ncbi:MAG: phosphotransferase [Mycoplasmoidaceae bacterium]
MSINDPINFFITNTNYLEKDIIKCKKIHHGFTNESFLLQTSDQQRWQVRFAGLNEVVKRSNEAEVLKLVTIDYMFYDEYGNSIRKWIVGKNLSLFFKKKKKLKLLCEQINRLHAIDISNNKKIIINDYLIYLDHTKNLDEKIKKLYIELVNKYEGLPKVLSHNDLSLQNVLWDGKNIIFIDYEWSRINDNYFDIANFVRESDLSLKWLPFLAKHLNGVDLKILNDFIFIVSCFAYQWTFVAVENDHLLRYRNKCYRKMLKIYKKI